MEDIASTRDSSRQKRQTQNLLYGDVMTWSIDNCMGMYGWMCIYVYTYIYMDRCVYTYVYIYIHICVYVYVYVYVCAPVALAVKCVQRCDAMHAGVCYGVNAVI